MKQQRENEQQFFITIMDVMNDGDSLTCSTVASGARSYELKDEFGYILAAYDGDTNTATYA